MDNLIHTRGIVLHKLRYGETSVIVKVYTEELGLQSYLVKGVSGKRSVGKMAQFEPLAMLELVAHHRPGKSLHFLRETRILHPYRSIPFDHLKTAVLLFVCELIYKVIREEESNPGLFHYIWDSLIRLDGEDVVIRDFPLFFLLRLLPFLGLTPLDNEGGERICFSLSGGSFVLPNEADASLVGPGLSYWLALLLRTPLQEYDMRGLAGPMRRDLLQLLLDYCQTHLGELGRIRSHEVLAKVLG